MRHLRRHLRNIIAYDRFKANRGASLINRIKSASMALYVVIVPRKEEKACGKP
jgi:hypothetical protein